MRRRSFLLAFFGLVGLKAAPPTSTPVIDSGRYRFSYRGKVKVRLTNSDGKFVATTASLLRA